MKKLISISTIALVITLIHSCNSGRDITFLEQENQVDVLVDGTLLTSYLYNSELLKPCLYPVNSLSGEEITRAFPFKEIDGESKDHPHHTGLYFTYASKGEVNGDSYWNLHEVPPLIKHISVNEASGGKNEGKLSVLIHWINSNNKAILEENRTMVFTVSEDKYSIDFSMILTALDSAVTFQDTKEGMFAIRVADWLAENAKGTLYESTGEYINAEGDKNEGNIWGKRSNWVRLEGKKEDRTIGIAIYHHPESVNFPTYWHARGYGCFAANPIGQFDFQKGRNEANPQHRNLTIPAGESALFKFRMSVYEGQRTMEQFEGEFEEFSEH